TALLILHWLHRKYHLGMVLMLPIVWTSLEYIRGNYLAGGFGWFNLAHSQAAWLPEHGDSRLIQIADLFGEYGVSFLVAMTNGLLVDLLTRPWVQSSAQGVRRPSRMLRAGLAVWVAAISLSLVYGW